MQVRAAKECSTKERSVQERRSVQPRSATKGRSAFSEEAQRRSAQRRSKGAQRRSAQRRREGAFSEGAQRRSAQRRSEGAFSEGAQRRSAQRRSALSTLSEGAFGEELWDAKKVCSSYTRAAEDGAKTKVEWRSEVRRNEGASSSMGGGEVNSGVLRAAACWRSGSRQ